MARVINAQGRPRGSVAFASEAENAAPKDADYLVRSTNADLSAERVVTDTPSIVVDWATAGQAKFQRTALTGDVTAALDSPTTAIDKTAITGKTTVSVASGDLVLIADVSDSNNLKKVTASDIASLASGVSDGDKGDITVSSSGAVFTIDSNVIDAGQYGPTFTSIANVDAVSETGGLSKFMYVRIRDYVYVSGFVTLDATTVSVLTRVGISLPIASDLTSQYNLSGGGSWAIATNSTGVRIIGDATNNRAELQVYPNASTSQVYNVWFIYKIE